MVATSLGNFPPASRPPRENSASRFSFQLFKIYLQLSIYCNKSGSYCQSITTTNVKLNLLVKQFYSIAPGFMPWVTPIKVSLENFFLVMNASSNFTSLHHFIVMYIQIMSNPLYYKIVSKAMHHILNAHLSSRSK